MFYRNWEPTSPPARHNLASRLLNAAQRSNLTVSVSIHRPLPAVKPLCKVPGCPILQCRLRTHRHYRHRHTQQHHTARKHVLALADTDHTSDRSNIQVQPGSQCSSFSMITKGIESLLALPIDGLDLPRVHEFFHMFFATGLPQLMRLTSPPPVTELQKRAATDFESVSLARALTSSFVCLVFVTAVYIPTALREGGGRIDRSGTILQGKLISLLRTRLADMVFTEAPDIAMAIFAITFIELAAGRPRSIEAHRDAMKNVVDGMGGLHNMGYATSFIAAFDSMTSNFSYTSMLFPPASGKRIRRPVQHPQVYGSFFEMFTPPRGIANDIVEFCADNCRLIELQEATGFSFGPADPLQDTPPDIHYLYYFREGQMNDFIILNQQTVEQEDVFRCMLIASTLVYYFLLHDNFVLMVSFRWANVIRAIVTKQGIDMSPMNRRILTWTMFVLTSMPVCWSGRQWASNYLKRLLDDKYVNTSWPASWKPIGTPWPGNWRDVELENVRSFTWSHIQLHSAWKIACNELDDGTIATPDWTQPTAD